MAKAKIVNVTGQVRSIVPLDEKRKVTNQRGVDTYFAYRMYLRGNSIRNAAEQLATIKNEDGKPVSFGAMMDDGTVVVDLTEMEVSRAIKMAGAESYRDLVGAGYEAGIEFRPKGSEYTDRKTGEIATREYTSAGRVNEMFELSQTQLVALKMAQLMLRQQDKKETEVFGGFGFGAAQEGDEAVIGSDSFTTTETPVDTATETAGDKKKK